MSDNKEKKTKRRAFVRPNCSKVWCFQCIVCGKKDYKFNAHPNCYRRWCDLCQVAFPTNEKMTEHAKMFHLKNWCDGCNQVYDSLKTHKTFSPSCKSDSTISRTDCAKTE